MENLNSKFKFMEKEQLVFKLNNSEKIIVQFPINDIIHCCYRADIYFAQYNHKILLTSWMLKDNIEKFKNVLELALQNKLFLPPEFTDEIGYLWNFIYKKKNIKDEYSDETFAESVKFNKYKIFEGYDYTVWMYNHLNGNIYLKITPLFPKGKPRNKIAKYNTFLSWMNKCYKPKLERIISKDIVMQWLDQANLILKTIDEND